MTELLSAVPIVWAKVMALAVFSGVLIAAWLLPRAGGILAHTSSPRWKDLRWWATILLVVQLALYWLF